MKLAGLKWYKVQIDKTLLVIAGMIRIQYYERLIKVCLRALPSELVTGYCLYSPLHGVIEQLRFSFCVDMCELSHSQTNDDRAFSTVPTNSITILHQLVINRIQINSGLPVKQRIDVRTVILIQWQYAFVEVSYIYAVAHQKISDSTYYKLSTALPCQPAFSMTSFSEHTNAPLYRADPLKVWKLLGADHHLFGCGESLHVTTQKSSQHANGMFLLLLLLPELTQVVKTQPWIWNQSGRLTGRSRLSLMIYLIS